MGDPQVTIGFQILKCVTIGSILPPNIRHPPETMVLDGDLHVFGTT